MNFSRPRIAARRLRYGALGLALLVAQACLNSPAVADTATRFVEQLRAEGHGDLVLDYLDRAKDDPLVSEAFRKTIPYQRTATLVAQAEGVVDPASRVAALEAVEPELRRLAASNDDAKRLLTDVIDRLATASADTARRAALEAERNPVASQRADDRKHARAEIEVARERLAKAESLIVAERNQLKGVQPASPEGRRRADLGARLGLVRLLGARLLLEQAQTFPSGSADGKKLNEEAAKELGALYEKYSKWGVGLYAHLYEGRSYRLLGQRALAKAALEDLTSQPASTADLRRIVTLAHAERSILLLGTGDADGALDKPRKWLDELPAEERNGPEGATLRYHLALAALAKADESDAAAQRKLRREARDWLGDAARVPSEVQADARERWAEVTASLGIETKAPETFDEAIAAGGEAIQSMLAFDLAIKGAAGEEASQLAGQRRESYAAAYAALEAAVKLANEKTDPEAAARARYQLAWLDWDGGDAAKAARRAELVARNDAGTESGEQAARLALAALERLQRDGVEDAAARLQRLASFVSGRWPGSDVARAASTVLMSGALRSGDAAAAEQVLQSVPDDQRPALALRLAVSQWEQKKSDPAQTPAALKSLQQAFAGVSDDGEASSLQVTAALYLAEAALDAGDVSRGKELLNDARFGPMARVKERAAPADNPVFALATLKSAARATALAGEDPAGILEQFAGTLAAAPAESTGGDRAWLGLAAALHGDLERADKDVKSASIAGALTQVLDRLTDVEASGDWNTRLWIAQARLRCGESLEDKAAARASVQAGREAFAGLIERSEKQPGFAPSSTSVLAARLRLAECERELGEHEAAIDTLAAMLDGGAVLLDVQRVAAETLQEWGAASKDASRLEDAIAGVRPGKDGKNLIWGWSKLAAVAGRFAGSDPKRRELYFDAWRHVAESRYEAAMLAGGATRTEQLRKAASTIAAVQRKNPELGGPDSKREYDRLLRAIQKASGQSPDGLTKAGG